MNLNFSSALVVTVRRANRRVIPGHRKGRRLFATVDLPNQTVADHHGLKHKFEIAPPRKEVPLKGLDDIGTSLQHEPEIAAYEKAHAATTTMYYRVDIKNYSSGG